MPSAVGILLVVAVSGGAFLFAPISGPHDGEKGHHGIGPRVAAATAPVPARKADSDDDDGPVGKATEQPAGKQVDLHKNEAASFNLDLQAQQAGGIAAAAPRSATLQPTTRAYATVPALDTLTSLYNTALINAAALQTATARAEAAKVASARAQGVLKVFSTAKAQAEAAEATVAVDQGGLATAKAQDAALRNTAVGDWGDTIGRAIADRSALATDLVQRRSTLVLVSIEAGSTAAAPPTVVLTDAAGRAVTGRFVSRAPRVDPRLQLPGFYYVVPAQAGLATGDTLVARIPGGPAQPGWEIPDTAVVWQGGRPWFYVREQTARFERHGFTDTAVPEPDGSFVVAASSLEPDEAVVTAGAQLLLSQEMHAQIPTDDD